MEILLLTLLGALTVGVGLWAASGDKKPDRGPGGGDPFGENRDDAGTGPRSSPGLPGAGAAGEAADAGKPVVLGKAPGDASGLEGLQKTLNQIPSPVTGKVVDPQEATGAGRKSPGKQRPLKVTYSTDDLIARSSRHAYHRRALANADTLVERQKGEEALAIFERVHQRVPDDEIQTRIQQNIEDIKRWLSGTDLEDEETIKFPEIIIPLTTQAIALENLSEGLRNISEGLVQQLANAFAGSPRADPGTGSPAGAPGTASPTEQSPGTPSPGGGAPGPAGGPASGSPTPSPEAGRQGGASAGPGTTVTGPVTATGPVSIGAPAQGVASGQAAPEATALRWPSAPRQAAVE
jgi:hypothetical protein